jgi:hypothetical protein
MVKAPISCRLSRHEDGIEKFMEMGQTAHSNNLTPLTTRVMNAMEKFNRMAKALVRGISETISCY